MISNKKYCIVYPKIILSNYNSGLVATLKYFLSLPNIKKENAITHLSDNMKGYVIILFHIIPNPLQKKKILKLKKNNKILYYFTDNHNKSFLNLSTSLFHKILLPDNVFLKEMYPDIAMKSAVFPWVLGYKPKKNLPFMKRKSKAIIFGSNGGKGVYPLRSKIRHYISKVKYSQDLQRSKGIKKQALMDYLSNYKIVIITKGTYPINYLLYKYVEAFASGALVFCEYVPLLEKLNYKPYVHYIPLKSCMANPISISSSRKLQTFFDLGDLNRKIEKYINNPKSQSIINRSMKLTNEKFGIKNRKAIFSNILKNL